MRLTIAERMTVLDLLPQQGNITTLQIVRDLQKKLSLTEEEIETFEVKQEKSSDGRVYVQWAPAYDKARVDITLSKLERAIIHRELIRLESNSQLPYPAFNIYGYFVENKEPEEV